MYILKQSHSIRRTIFIFLGLFFLAQAFLPYAYCLEVPALKGRVNDYGNILSTATETQLDHYLQQLEQTDSTQIAVLTIPSLEGESLEGFSLKVVESWKIGQAETDNGALLLVAVSDRKIRIEVGYGLEGSLTDLQAGRIIRNVILPKFKQGNFDQGVIDGVSAMIQTVKGEYTPPESHSGKKKDDPFGFLAILLLFFFFIGNVLHRIFRKNKLANALAGGIIAPLLGTIFLGFSLPLLIVFILFGIIFGLISSRLSTISGRSGRSGYFYSGGGFGSSSSGGFGGFSGGGGGFGGGGASGGW